MAERKPRKPPGNFGKPKDPDENWDPVEIDVAEAIKQAQRIVDKIDEAPEWAIRRAGDFLNNVGDTVAGVLDRLKKTRRCSEKLQAALDNWEAGVDKCTGSED